MWFIRDVRCDNASHLSTANQRVSRVFCGGKYNRQHRKPQSVSIKWPKHPLKAQLLWENPSELQSTFCRRKNLFCPRFSVFNVSLLMHNVRATFCQFNLSSNRVAIWRWVFDVWLGIRQSCKCRRVVSAADGPANRNYLSMCRFNFDLYAECSRSSDNVVKAHYIDLPFLAD